MSILDEALRYQQLGLSVIPIRPGTKRPAITSWKQYATTPPTESEIRQWFDADRHYALAIVCGPASGDLIVRDFDTMESYSEWALANPTWAKELPTVATDRGRHVYCRGELNLVRSISKGGGATAKFADGELRSGDCYVVAPPSLHPKGTPYQWEIPIIDAIPRVDLREAGLIPSNGENRELREDGGVLKTLVSDKGCEPSPLQHFLHLPCLPYSLDTLSSPLQERIQQAIEHTLPRSTRKRHDQVFELARELKAIPELAHLPPKAHKEVVRLWYELGKAFFSATFDETWFDFCEGWDKVRFPKGQEPIAIAFRRAKSGVASGVATQYEAPKIRLLVSWCHELQRLHGKGPFYLGCRTAGKFLDIDHSTAARWLRGLCHDEVLREIHKGSQRGHKASRYQYLGEIIEEFANNG